MLTPFTGLIHWTLDLLGFYYILSESMIPLLRLVCGIDPYLCRYLESFVINSDYEIDDITTFQVYMSRYPQRVSTQNLAHLS